MKLSVSALMVQETNDLRPLIGWPLLPLADGEQH